ncbi:MAG: hypothetical protein JFT11_06580 [Muribaculaceae bacterium]|nr:hypothetical protein [Muribaculaceae bacterium]
MKKFTSVICATAAVAGMLTLMTACDTKAKLAESVQGKWTGNPEKMLDTGAASASMVRTLEFTKGAADTEGSVTMTAIITVENTMQSNDSIVTPLQITASGVATITGVYQAKDDDELTISLDATSMNVNVDPDAVKLNYNIATATSAPLVEKLKPGAAILATQQINRAAQNAFSNITEIDDIKIEGSIMHCEINHTDLTFTKSTK